MHRRELLKLGAATLGGICLSSIGEPAALAAAVRVSSHFNESTEGWTGYDIITSDELVLPTWDGTTSPPPVIGRFVDRQGTNGYLYTSAANMDVTSLYFRAPSKFRGTAAAYGDVLAFDYAAGGRADIATRDLFLSGSGLTLRYPMSRASEITRHKLRLSAGAGWLRADTGAEVTLAEFKRVLSAVDNLLIPATWGGYEDSTEASYLDEVAIEAGGGGKVRLNHASLRFGTVTVGRSERIQIVVSNRSRTQGDLLSVKIHGPVEPFVTEMDGAEVDIEPRSFLRFNVGFAPTARGRATGELILETSDLDFPQIKIPLSGSGRIRRRR